MKNIEKSKPRKIRLNKDQTIMFYKSKEQELQKIASRIREVDSLFVDIKKAEEVLKTMSKLKDREKLLINVGVGVLVECEITNNKSAKISLPGSIVIDKKVPEILENIKKRKEELLGTKRKLTELYTKTLKTLQAVSKALQQIEKNQNLKSQVIPKVS